VERLGKGSLPSEHPHKPCSALLGHRVDAATLADRTAHIKN